MKKYRLFVFGLAWIAALAYGQEAQKSINYKFRIKNQRQYYDVDPNKNVFGSEQTYTIQNTGAEKTRLIVFGLHPQLLIESLTLKDNNGQILSHGGAKPAGKDFRLGSTFTVYEAETEIDIAPGQLLDFVIRYKLSPDAVAEWPKFWWNLTISRNASFAITPAAGNNVIFGLNYRSPFVIRIRYPEGNLACVPGNRVSSEKTGGYCVETFESKTPNIPVFACAPYKKIERRSQGYSIEFFLYPHETLPEEMADQLFAAVFLYAKYFGDNGAREYRVATAGPYQATASGAENKGNCVFMMDRFLRDALKTQEGKWDYLATLFHEAFHNWNLFSLNWSGDYGEWFGEGGAAFIQAWAAEMILGPSAARSVRKTFLRNVILGKVYQVPAVLAKAEKRSRAEIALIYYYGALVWEQLRQKLGDEIFFAGFGDFLKQNMFKNETGFKDLTASWAPYTKLDIPAYLAPWIDHNARISLSVEKVETRAKDGAFITEVALNVDSDRDYEIITALEYQVDSSGPARSVPLNLVKKGIQTIRFESDKEPIFIQIDPEFRVPWMTDGKLTWEKR